MKRLTRPALLFVLLTLPFWAACNGDDGETPAPRAGEDVAAADLSPKELGALGAELYRSPDRAEQILADRGIDPDEFEAAVREVAADTGDAREYAEAFGEAEGDAGTNAAEGEDAPVTP